MDVGSVFEWLGTAATGGLSVIVDLSGGITELFVTTTEGGVYQPTFIGMLVIAGVGAPLAWKFIKYIISLFKKVQPN